MTCVVAFATKDEKERHVRALVQRVSEADVSIAGTVVGQSGPGLLVLICAMQGDSDKTAQTMATKLAKLRIFKDAEGKMNHSVCEVGGSALVVSQFTLAADTRRGTRPGFSSAARPEEGERLYELFVQILKAEGVPVETGRFGAEMQVRLVNDGPVTIWLEV